MEDVINYTMYLKDMVQQVTDNHIYAQLVLQRYSRTYRYNCTIYKKWIKYTKYLKDMVQQVTDNHIYAIQDGCTSNTATCTNMVIPQS